MSATAIPGSSGDPVIAPVGIVTGGQGQHRVDAADPGASLAPALARLAWVRCVTEVHLGPVNESALLLDEAAAMALAGEVDTAVMLVGMAEWLAEDLVAAVEDESLLWPVSEELRLLLETVAAHADQCTSPQAVIHRLGQWLARLDEVRSPGEGNDGPSVADHRVAAFLAAGPGGSDAEPEMSDLAMDSGSVDVARTPPRLVVSRPAGGEVLVEYVLAGDAPVSATATVQLVPGVDPDLREVSRLRLVAFDSGGELVAVAALESASGVLVTSITDRQALRAAQDFAVVSADSGLVGLRGGGHAAVKTTVDRLASHAWTAVRLAGVGAAAPGDAVSLAGRAAAVLEDGIARYPELAAEWRRRHDALLAWVEAAQSGTGDRPERYGASRPDRPLLAEMLAVTWDY